MYWKSSIASMNSTSISEKKCHGYMTVRLELEPRTEQNGEVWRDATP